MPLYPSLIHLASSNVLHPSPQPHQQPLVSTLQHISYIACHHEDITYQNGGVQKNLDRRATLKTFKTIMEKEAASKGLVLKDVQCRFKHLYHEVSKHTHRNTSEITVRAKDLVPNEYAAIITLFKCQDRWTDRLPWKEEKR